MYPVMVEPPRTVGADHEIVADCDAVVTLVIVTEPGASYTTTAPEAAEAALVKGTALVVVAVKVQVKVVVVQGAGSVTPEALAVTV